MKKSGPDATVSARQVSDDRAFPVDNAKETFPCMYSLLFFLPSAGFHEIDTSTVLHRKRGSPHAKSKISDMLHYKHTYRKF